MGWLARIFGVASREELRGLVLDISDGCWVIGETADLAAVLESLPLIIDESCFLFFEGGRPGAALREYIESHQVEEQEKVPRATVWPRLPVVHLPATLSAIQELAQLAANSSPFEFGVHFRVYRKGEVVLEWHDAFMQEMLVSKDVPESKVMRFAKALGVEYHYHAQPQRR